MKYPVLLFVVLSLTGCGMGKAARDSGQRFDKYGCMARNFKGETPCAPASVETGDER